MGPLSFRWFACQIYAALRRFNEIYVHLFELLRAPRERLPIGPLSKLGFVDFRDYFGLFSIVFAGVISTSYMTPAKQIKNRPK
jgi:hypothetical protein